VSAGERQLRLGGEAESGALPLVGGAIVKFLPLRGIKLTIINLVGPGLTNPPLASYGDGSLTSPPSRS
jgi:hypothetical protein